MELFWYHLDVIGFKCYDLGLGSKGLGFKFKVLNFMVYGLGLGLRFMIYGLGHKIFHTFP